MSEVKIKTWILICEFSTTDYVNALSSTILLYHLPLKAQSSATALCSFPNLVSLQASSVFFSVCLCSVRNSRSPSPSSGSPSCQHHAPHYTHFHKHQSLNSASPGGGVGGVLFCGRNIFHVSSIEGQISLCFYFILFSVRMFLSSWSSGWC